MLNSLIQLFQFEDQIEKLLDIANMLPLLELADQNVLRRSGIFTTHTQSTFLETLPNEILAQIFNHYIVHRPELN